MTDNAPGWQADPTGRHEHRYWDGTAWTDNVSDAGVASTDAYATADAAPEVTAEPEAPTEPVAETPAWADPTAVTTAPTTDPTATWPTAPSPPPAPTYTPPGADTNGPIGPDGSGGSKKGLFIGIGVLAAVAVVVAVLLAGGGDEDDSVRTQLAAQFRTNSELSDDQADCVADYVVDEMGEDSFEGVDFSADEPPDEIADDMFAAAFDSLESCDIDPADFAGSGSDDDDDSDSGDAEGGDDSSTDTPEFPADFEDQIADAYETSLGLSREKAECLAGKISKAVESGDLNEEEAMSEIFEYLSDCDIDMSEIGNPSN